MEVAAATILIILALIPGFLFWAGFYAPVFGYLEYDVSSWRTPGQLARTVVTAHVVHLILLAAIWLVSVATKPIIGVAEECVSARGCIGLTITKHISQVFESTLFAVRDALKGEVWVDISVDFALLNFYLIGAAALAFLAGRVIGRWGIVPAFQGLARSEFAKQFVAHRFVYELVQDVQYRGLVKTAYLLARFDESGRRCIYRGVVEDFNFSKDGTLTYIVLTTLAKALRREPRPDENEADNDDISWVSIGSRDSGRAYFRGDELENALFENAPVVSGKPQFGSPSDVNEFAMKLNAFVRQIVEQINDIESKIKKPKQH